MIAVAEYSVDVIHLGKFLEERYQVQQFGIGHVVEPRRHRYLEWSVELESNVSNDNSNYYLPTALSGWNI